ncbi:10470_t:CDS:2, partial [Dentiscutata erythropus]
EEEELLNQFLEAYLGKRERDEDNYFKIPEVNTFGIPFRKEEFKTENKTKPTKRSTKKSSPERKKSTKLEKKEVLRLLHTKEFDIAEQMQKQEAGIT